LSTLPINYRYHIFEGKEFWTRTYTGEDNIKLGIKEVGCEAVDWMTWDRIESRTHINTAMNVWVP
jgi:hypothetical protein